MAIVTTTYRYKPPPKRKGRKLAEIIARITQPIDAERRRRILGEFDRICEVMFSEPAFASACLRKVAWEVKRKLVGLVDRI